MKTLLAKTGKHAGGGEVAACPASPRRRVARARRERRAARARRTKLDEAFFRGYVEPILEKRGKDGYACVHCHATHTLFNATYRPS